MPSKPKWVHDCDDCIFLGTVVLNGEGPVLSQRFDLYACKEGDGFSFIARYGDDGPEYSSMPELGLQAISQTPVDELSPLSLALELARRAFNFRRLGNRVKYSR